MPTRKQQLVVKELLADPSKSMAQAMRDAGYSERTARVPSDVTRSKGWKELVEEYFPDEVLVRVGAEGLEATKIVSSHTEPDYEVPDHNTRYRFWDRILEMKGYSEPIAQGNNTMNIGTLINNFTEENATR